MLEIHNPSYQLLHFIKKLLQNSSHQPKLICFCWGLYIYSVIIFSLAAVIQYVLRCSVFHNFIYEVLLFRISKSKYQTENFKMFVQHEMGIEFVLGGIILGRRRQWWMLNGVWAFYMHAAFVSMLIRRISIT